MPGKMHRPITGYGEWNEQRPNTYLNQLNFNRRFAFSFSLEIPIFNGWRVRETVNEAKIAYENSKYEAENVKNELRKSEFYLHFLPCLFN